MKNDYLAAQHWILKHLPNPNRPSVRELEDLLVSYADAVSKPLLARLAKKDPPAKSGKPPHQVGTDTDRAVQDTIKNSLR